jgi:hypothetical protein
MVYVIFGVSSSGKTTIGKKISIKLGIPFYDADDFHSNTNIEKSTNPINDMLIVAAYNLIATASASTINISFIGFVLFSIFVFVSECVRNSIEIIMHCCFSIVICCICFKKHICSIKKTLC